MDSTYNKLIEAGVKLFGEQGYDAVSVRDIVRESEANLSAISYHFGGKAELYKAVVIFLLDEVKVTLDKIDVESFATLPKAQMEERMREIILAFHQLFVSQNGKYRFNIFTRESTMPDKNLAHKYFADMIQSVYSFFHQIFNAFYSCRNESLDKIDFVIYTIMSILKNIPQQENLTVKLNLESDEIVKRLSDLIISGKF